VPSISREALTKLLPRLERGSKQEQIALLRLNFSRDSHTLNHFLSKLQGVERIYPRMLPTQASGRWSTTDPPLTNFEKRCINPDCPQFQHSKTNQCWSVRDCVVPDFNEVMFDGDYDAVEARLFAVLLGWKERVEEFNKGWDIHTPTCCGLFNLPLPQDKVNPHTSEVDEGWRKQVNWRGKDDPRRTLGKNYTFGSQYFYTALTRSLSKKRGWVYTKVADGLYLKYNPQYCLTIPHISELGLSEEVLVELARKYVELTKDIQAKKAVLQDKIRRTKVARTLFQFKREFMDTSYDTAKEGFNHMIQGTVVGLMNRALLRLQKQHPQMRLVLNAHDGCKVVFPKEECISKEEFKEFFEGNVVVNGLKVNLTMTTKVTHGCEL